DLVVIHSVSTSDDSPAISQNIPGKTKSRGEVQQIALNRLFRHPGVSYKQKAWRSVGLYDRLNTGFPRRITAIFLLPRKPRFVANAQVQTEAWHDLQVVLQEELMFPGNGKAIRRAEPITHLIESAQEKICRGVPRAGSTESSTPCTVAADQIECDVHPLVTPFERV